MGTENNKTSVHGDSPEHREARGPRRARTFAPLVFALAATLLSLGIGWLFFGLTYYNMDTISFMFQARLFAQGRLAADVPPDPGFSPSININIVNGKWYSKYPFGNALALALGVALGAPWLVPAIATGGAIWFLYWILFDAYGRRTALLGCLLALISPSTLVLGGVGLSETVNRFFLSMFLFGVTRSVARPGWWYPALTGFSLGYAFNTKPLTAVAFGVCGAGYWLYSLRVDRRGLSRCIVTAAAPLVLMLTLFLAWNTYGTGSPWRMTHTALHRYDVLGFGRRSMVVPEPSYVYTPAEALSRVFTKTIPAVSHTTLGWGNYSPRFASSFVKGSWRSRFTIALSVSPLALLWLLAFLPLADRSRNRYDALFFSLPALTLFAALSRNL